MDLPRNPLPTHTSFLHACNAQRVIILSWVFFPIFKNTRFQSRKCIQVPTPKSGPNGSLLSIPHDNRTQSNQDCQGNDQPSTAPISRRWQGFYLTHWPALCLSPDPRVGDWENLPSTSTGFGARKGSVWVHFQSWRILAIVNLWGSVSLPVNHTYRIVGITQCIKKVWLVPKDNCSQ